MRFVAIILLSVAGSVAYGVCHDQVTVRICVEYFSIGHPPVFDATSPTWLALMWGWYATWWMGVILGVPLAIAARVGRRPKMEPAELVRPIGLVLASMAAASVLAGIIGYVVASAGGVHLVGRWAKEVPAERHVVFLTDLWAHNAAYLVGGLGGIWLWIRTWRTRGRRAAESTTPRDHEGPGAAGSGSEEPGAN